ncbi:FHA domain-containing protein [Leucobacter rhizosphaerae]|uniref:FHA domain-containing protein n=1 Tax=Leucobacter rhizosphaerae TaxID=2932245 RepID=A0ABY4G002_9MICO|nr:FtsK/SpoIIIE domain-containing protein [Leucobacter rhizosphaerae]UOQ61649.1 FHA domain-containing protein [Leucobacter rhizosphaerae]
MRFRVTLELPGMEPRDITLEGDATVTVADTACALVRAGAAAGVRWDPEMTEARVSVTLAARDSLTAQRRLLDPSTPLLGSGLQSGWTIEPVLEFGAHGATRLIPLAGHLEVLSGAHRGAVHSLVQGEQLIGRDPRHRVPLTDPSVSRRHAVVSVGREVTLHDLGSANGVIVDGSPTSRALLTGVHTVELGEVVLRVTLGPPVVPARELRHTTLHTRSPRVVEAFSARTRALPSPPVIPSVQHLPVIAMLSPMLMGGAVFALTRAPMSLLMVAMAPVMLLGSWADGAFGGRRRHRRLREQFATRLVEERTELARLHAEEIAVREREAPELREILHAVRDRSELLWTRRPEHASFLEVRIGTGELVSRTALEGPPDSDATPEDRAALVALADEWRSIAPVPVVEALDRCGALGIAGDARTAAALARSIVLQLVALRAPADLVMACVGGPRRTGPWDWMKWLPHVDHPRSPVAVPHLAADDASAGALISALEDLQRQRAAARDGLAHPVVVVLVLAESAERPRFIALAEHGPEAGIHCIWVAEHRRELPAACRTFAEVHTRQGTVGFVQQGSVVALRSIEGAESVMASRVARSLAAVEDAGEVVAAASDLPRTVQLRDLHSADVLGGGAAILDAWAASDTLTSRWRSGVERTEDRLVAVVGQSADGPVSIDLRTHGPHALVAGTTGSGKSEFLQTWILSLAASISPDRLTLLLVDYKGGAAFAECVALPHTVGLLTDLTPRLVRRALRSLRAELRHREELFAHHRAKDLAALARDVPEFVTGVVDIAQRGRSLGLHLVLATQRPAGVITEQLRANTNLRIALRMADDADSSDVLGVPDAAHFAAETPGRAAIKIGPGRIRTVQTCYVGGRASGASDLGAVRIASLGWGARVPWDVPRSPRAVTDDARTGGDRDIEVLARGISDAARTAALAAPRRPWLDELPPLIDSAALSYNAGLRADIDTTTIGLLDLPDSQAQRPESIDFDAVGHVAFLGASGTGKSTALLSVAAALSAAAERFPVHLYAIDGGNGGLGALVQLPTVGAVVPLSDLGRVTRVLRHLQRTISDRGPRFSAARAGTLSETRVTAAGNGEARVVLLLDGFSAFRQASDDAGAVTTLLPALTEIMAAGRALGVHVVMTADRASAIPTGLTAHLPRQYAFRMSDARDGAVFGFPADLLADAPPGRAVRVGEGAEVQIAVPGGSPDRAGLDRSLAELAADLLRCRIAPAPVIQTEPVLQTLQELPPSGRGEHGGSKPDRRTRADQPDRIAIGLRRDTLEALTMPTRGLGVVFGPAGSGVTTALETCAVAWEEHGARHGVVVESILLTLQAHVSQEAGIEQARSWSRVASGEDAVAREAARLVDALQGAQRMLVVVERAADAADPGAQRALAALARAARRSAALVLFDLEPGAAAQYWELLGALKQPTWGLTLQPDAGEPHSPFREPLGRARRADFAPGRGFAIEAGRVTPALIAVHRLTAATGEPIDGALAA